MNFFLLSQIKNTKQCCDVLKQCFVWPVTIDHLLPVSFNIQSSEEKSCIFASLDFLNLYSPLATCVLSHVCYDLISSTTSPLSALIPQPLLSLHLEVAADPHNNILCRILWCLANVSKALDSHQHL